MPKGSFVIPGGGGIPEAPSDGKGYVRKNAGWAEESGGSGLDFGLTVDSEGYVCQTIDEVENNG